MILHNQHLILSIIDQDNKKEHENAMKALQSGYEFDIDRLADGFSDGFSEDDCKEVREIMEMNYQLEEAARRHGLTYQFDGFDGNNESEQCAYARHCWQDRGEWEGLSGGRDKLNSHSRSMDRHRRMLNEWRRIEDELKTGGPWNGLTKEQAERLIEAGNFR